MKPLQQWLITLQTIIELSLIVICIPSMSAFSQEIWVYGDINENFKKGA